jgi:hypothetical protein
MHVIWGGGYMHVKGLCGTSIPTEWYHTYIMVLCALVI